MCRFLGHVVMGSLALRRCIVRIFRYPVRFSCLVVWAFSVVLRYLLPWDFSSRCSLFSPFLSPALRVLLPAEVEVYHLVLTNYYSCFFSSLVGYH
jgi:hypothetical protein